MWKTPDSPTNPSTIAPFLHNLWIMGMTIPESLRFRDYRMVKLLAFPAVAHKPRNPRAYCINNLFESLILEEGRASR